MSGRRTVGKARVVFFVLTFFNPPSFPTQAPAKKAAKKAPKRK